MFQKPNAPRYFTENPHEIIFNTGSLKIHSHSLQNNYVNDFSAMILSLSYSAHKLILVQKIFAIMQPQRDS